MTVALLFANNASSRLYAAIDASTTSIRVEAGDGAKFPVPIGDGSNYFIVTVEDRRTGQIEVMKCTANVTDILTVVRAQEGTTAKAFALGASVSNRLTKGVLDYLANGIIPETGATILAKLLTVDGAGSLLDADLLDGQQGAFYQNASNLNAGTIPAARFTDATHGNRGGGPLHAAATGAADGFMAAADKTKLDAIEAGATADMTAAEILAAVITVDGAGSGLDADFLDGQSGAAYHAYANLTGVPLTFAPSAHTHAESEIINLTADLAAKAPLASPALTGVPTAPTAALATNTTQLATTEFVTNAIIAGSSTSDHISQVGADMYLGYKTGPNRLVLNDNAVGTGSDVAVVDDLGNFSGAGGTTVGLFMINALLNAARTAYNAMTTGFAGLFQFNKTNGEWRLSSTNASVAPATAVALKTQAIWPQTGGMYLYGPMSLSYDTAVTVADINSRSAITARGDFSFTLGYGILWNSYYDSSGAVYEAMANNYGLRISGDQTSGTIAFARAPAVAAGATQVYANLMTMDPTNGMSVIGNFSTSGNVVTPTLSVGTGDGNSAGNGLILRQRTSGFSEGIYFYDEAGAVRDAIFADASDSLIFRVGDNVTADVSFGASGGITATGSIVFNQNLSSSTTALVMGTTGAGNVYMRPQGVGSTTSQTYITSAGNMVVDGSITTINSNPIVCTNNITALQNFLSSNVNTIMAPASAGTCYLRPGGVGVSTAQFYVTSGGTINFNGDLVICNGVAENSINTTSFPIGTRLFVRGTAPNRTTPVTTIRLDASRTAEYTVAGTGSIVAGTWAQRGGSPTDGFLAERVG
jgi:hypothetical protein